MAILAVAATDMHQFPFDTPKIQQGESWFTSDIETNVPFYVREKDSRKLPQVEARLW